MAVERESDGHWKSGQSGNPKGRPLKGKALTELLEKYMRKRTIMELSDDKIKRMPAKDRLVIELLKKAIGDKDLRAIKIIFERLEGRPAETVFGKLQHDVEYTVRAADPEAFTDVEETTDDDNGGSAGSPEESQS